MKSKKIIILERLLRLMAKAVLAKYEPIVVGITGSVGKTSAKEAIFSVLSKQYRTRKNEKNYNNEIGIPLTVIGAETGGRSLRKWAGVFLGWLRMMLFREDYPEILVLEMGVDRPGDMRYLTSFIRPSVGVVTNISSSHIEFFGSLDSIAQEKGILVESLPAGGFAVLNADDELAAKMALRTEASKMTFGFSEGSGVNGAHVAYHYDDDAPDGISFKLGYDGKSMPVRLKGILAKHQVNAALSAVAVGLSFKMNLVDIAQSLERFNPPPGRLNIIRGLNGSFLIDDTYNASPASTVAALEVLSELKAERRIAVLGDMLELGEEEERGHDAVAGKVMEMDPDLFFAVGARMGKAAEKMIAKGYPKEKVHRFADPESAGEKVRSLVMKKDLVLIKGSQGMRMEKVTEGLMLDPLESGKFLCRQGADWKKKPFAKP